MDEFVAEVEVQEDGPLAKYQREHERKLKEQAQQSAEDQEKIRAAAQAEIEKFQKERAQKAEKARNNNKAAEKELYHEEEAEKKGNPWEKIVSLVDLKVGKTEGKDVSAMRRLLVEAKHLPAKSH